MMRHAKDKRDSPELYFVIVHVKSREMDLKIGNYYRLC